MKCLACDVILTDEEANRKFSNCEEIPNPEDRYINLCNRCLGVGSEDSLEDLEAVIYQEED